MIPILRKLISETPAYTSMTDDQIAADLNTAITIPNQYMLTDVRLVACIGLTYAVEVFSQLKTKSATDNVSAWIYDKLTSTIGLDVSNPAAAAIVNSFVSSNIITQAQANSILALGTATTTKAKEDGIDITVMNYHVKEARGGV